ncbi:MAG: hypothetical protein KDK39_00235 [Leptospiraceae bacterium]|nr:hypothetical protein [Leptospiraceae bacterium]
MVLDILQTSAIILGLILAVWGLFHQLIVGGALMVFEDLNEQEARILIMSWVAQGAFMSFTGVVTALSLFFHGIMNEAVRTVIAITGVALLLMASHVFVSGYRIALKPVRVGAILELLTGAVLLVLSVWIMVV